MPAFIIFFNWCFLVLFGFQVLLSYFKIKTLLKDNRGRKGLLSMVIFYLLDIGATWSGMATVIVLDIDNIVLCLTFAGIATVCYIAILLLYLSGARPEPASE